MFKNVSEYTTELLSFCGNDVTKAREELYQIVLMRTAEKHIPAKFWLDVLWELAQRDIQNQLKR